ncbi:HNH endonuclease [Streptomyces sp. NBC_00984]|uniref:HNH endonuclease n=1 Tax=Streptomyces sp. NBC_00984 TaxID=2903700 RepID=UPI00386C9254
MVDHGWRVPLVRREAHRRTSRGDHPTRGSAPPRINSRRPSDVNSARKLKHWYQDSCQICATTLVLPSPHHRYSEAAHIRAREDGGPDLTENLLCLCPNCHVRFDGGTYVPTDDLTVVDTVEDRPEVKLKPHQWHYINPAYVRHHRHRSTSRNPHLLWWGDGFDAVIGDGCISTSAGEFLRRLAGVGRLTIAPISRGFGHSRFQLHFTPHLLAVDQSGRTVVRRAGTALSRTRSVLLPGRAQGRTGELGQGLERPGPALQGPRPPTGSSTGSAATAQPSPNRITRRMSPMCSVPCGG